MSRTSCYSDKINIYDNSNFIPIPNWVSCIPPPLEIIAPAVRCQPSCGPPITTFLPQPVNPILSYYVYQDVNGNSPQQVVSAGCKSCQ